MSRLTGGTHAWRGLVLHTHRQLSSIWVCMGSSQQKTTQRASKAELAHWLRGEMRAVICGPYLTRSCLYEGHHARSLRRRCIKLWLYRNNLFMHLKIFFKCRRTKSIHLYSAFFRKRTWTSGTRRLRKKEKLRMKHKQAHLLYKGPKSVHTGSKFSENAHLHSECSRSSNICLRERPHKHGRSEYKLYTMICSQISLSFDKASILWQERPLHKFLNAILLRDVRMHALRLH